MKSLTQHTTYYILHTIKRVFRWLTATRRRKILSSILAVLIVLTSIRFAFFNKPKEVAAAKMELLETDSTIQIDVPFHYRAILQKGDTDEYLLLYDRAENNSAPKAVMEFESPRIHDENVDYHLKFDGSRKTTVLESSNVRIKIRVEGCFDTAAGGACLKDVDGDNDEVIQIIEEYTFTPEGFYKNIEIDFKNGYESDDVDYNDSTDDFFLYYNQNTWGTEAYDGEVYYGDGNTEATASITGTLTSTPDHYVVLQGTGNFQDVSVGTLRIDGDRHLSNSANALISFGNSANYDYLRFREGSQTISGKGNTQFYFLFKPQSELDSEAEREGVFNDLTNPDTLSFTTGDLWDDKPISSGGIATSSAVLFHSGFEGGDTDLCDGGDGWSPGDCEGSNTAVGNETTTVFDDTYSGKFTSVGVVDEAHVTYIPTNRSNILHGRVYFRLDYEDLVDTAGLGFMSFNESTAWTNTYLGVRQNGSNLELYVRDQTGWSGVGSDGYIQLDTWYCAEMRVYRHDSLGMEEVWLNDKPVYSASSRNTGAYDYNYINAGIMYSGSFNNQIYLDDAVFSQSKIGCAEFNEGQGAYGVDASANHSEFDIDAGNNISTTLNGAASSGATSVTLTSVTGFPDGAGSTDYIAYIEGDKITYNDVSGSTLAGIPTSGENAVNYHATGAVVSRPQRHSPSFNMRGYRNTNVPEEAVLEGKRLRNGYGFIGDIKPFSAAYFADELYMHYSLEDTNVNIGDANLTCDGGFVAGKYGNGIETNSDGEDCNVAITEGADYIDDQGTVEFWYQPYYNHNDSATHYIFSIREGSDNNMTLQKQTDNDLEWKIEDNSVDHLAIVDDLDYSWDAYDWVHIRVTWDASEPLATQARIFINGEEPPHSDDPESDDFDGVFTLTLDSLVIGNAAAAGTYEANGVIDEFKLYNTDNAISTLGEGGNNYRGNEYLANENNDYSLAFVDDDIANRGEYIWLGSDSAFSGVNVDLETDGVGAGENFVWEYWDGTGWTTLTVTEQETGASEWLADGNFYFTPPPDWIPYSVNGSTDLYYIRGHLEGGSYPTTPVENKILTDIVTFQYTRYGGAISSENMTFEIPGWTSNAPPVAYWKFDEGYGTTANDSTGNNSLTIKDATWQEESLCISGKCLHYDGSEDMASRSAQLTQLDFKETNSFTLTGWFKHPSSVTGTDTLISKYESTGSDGGYKVYMNSSGYLCAGVDDDNTWGPDDPACTTSSYADSKWHHFSAVKTDTTQLDLYIDGNRVAYDDNIAATSTLENNDGFYVGADESGYQNYWDGFIDEVKVYRYARSAYEIKVDYTGGAAVFGDRNDWLSDGLVGYWKMDDNVSDVSQTVADSSGNGQNGTTGGSASINCGFVGKFSYGCDYDGTDDYVSVADNSVLEPSDDFTVAAWVKFDTLPGSTDSKIVYKDHPSGPWVGYELFYDGDNTDKFIFGFANDNSDYFGAYWNGTPAATTWYHMVGVRRGNVVDLYINGDNSNTTQATNASGSLYNTSNPLYFGGVGTSNSLDGQTDEVRIYNRALSPAEVQSLYQWAPGPILHYKFDENTGTTIYNSAVNENHGTLEDPTGSNWIPGKFGSALDFTMNDERVFIEDDDLLDVKTMTLSMWYKPTANPPVEDYHLADKLIGSGNQRSWQLYQNFSTNDIRMQYDPDGTDCCDVIVSSDNALTPGTWYHIATSFDGSYAKLYIDGILQADVEALSGTIFASTSPIAIGGDNDAGNDKDVNGIIDDFRIYNYARTPSQIVSDMNAGHPAPGSPVGSAIGEWHFDEGYGDIAYDSGTGGNNGDLGGSGQSCPTPGDTSTPCPSWTNNGIYGKALDFEISGTTDDYIDLGNPTDLQITGAITLSAWVKQESLFQNTRYITKSGASGSRGWELNFEGDSTDQVFFSISSNGTTQYDAETNFSLTAGVWYHFVGVYEPSTAVKLYVNGVLNAENRVSIPASQYNTSNNVYISNRAGCGNCYMDGIIDEIRVYNSALSANQVKILYSQGSAAVWGATSTDSSGNASWSANDEYCPPGQGSACTPPIAEWKFDENTGTGDGSVYDTSGNGYTLDMEPSMTETDWMPGKFGSALDFDGTDDLLINGSSSGLSLTDTLTLSAWIKADVHDGTVIYRGHNDGNYATYRLAVWTNGELFFSYRNSAGSSSHTFTSTSTYTWTDDWHHIAVSHTYGSGSATKLYRDGAEIAGFWESGDGNDAPYTQNWSSVGERGFGSYASDLFNGLIDDVKIFDYVRTPAQIAWDYNRGGPVGWWKMDENTGTSNINDSMGNINPLTVVGSPTWSTGKRNTSLYFDGSDDFIDETGSAPYDSDLIITGDLTLAFWLKGTSFAADDVILNHRCNVAGSACNNNYILRTQDGSGNDIEYEHHYGSEQAESYTFDVNLNTGTWYHLTFVRDVSANTVKMYVDGVQTSTTFNYTNDPTDGSNGQLRLGNSSSSGSAWFNGYLDDLRIYNYPLTPQQIRGVISEGAMRFGPNEGSP